MQLLLPLLCTLASLSAVHAASVPAVGPRSSLQDASQKRDAYRRRQASSRDVVRRQREGPKKRLQSPAVCADVIGQEKIINGNFALGSTPWIYSGNSPNAGINNGVGYRTSGSDDYVAFDTSYLGQGTAFGSIKQTVTLCADATYTLQFYSGLAHPNGNPDPTQGCTVVATVGGAELSNRKVCESRSCPLTSFDGNPWRTDTITFNGVAGPADVVFTTTCTSVFPVYTNVDIISLKRTA